MEEGIHSTPEVPSEVSDEPIKRLRMLVHASAVSILILAGTVFVFLYRQVVTVRRNTSELANYIGEYERSDATAFIADAHRRLYEFQQAHPDYGPIYLRYFGTNAPPPPPAETNSKVVPLASPKVSPQP